MAEYENFDRQYRLSAGPGGGEGEDQGQEQGREHPAPPRFSHVGHLAFHTGTGRI